MTDDKRQRSVKRSDKRPIVWCLVSRTRLTRLSMTSETLCVWATPPCTRSKTSSPGSTKTPNEAQCLCVLVNNWYMFINLLSKYKHSSIHIVLCSMFLLYVYIQDMYSIMLVLNYISYVQRYIWYIINIHINNMIYYQYNCTYI